MDKTEFKTILKKEKSLYLGKNRKILIAVCHKKRYTIWKYIRYFRLMQFYKEKISSLSFIMKVLYEIKYYYYLRKKNILGEKCGVEITNESIIGANLDIWHSGVIISGTLGDNCVFRGNNTVGFKSKDGREGNPVIGNGVEIGAGAVIIGGISIADGCMIGANAVVTKSVGKPNSVLAGIPARVMEK